VSPPQLPPGEHLDLLQEAIAAEAGAQRALRSGDAGTAAFGFRAAERRYRASWEVAPPASYGRLVGMLKAAVLAGAAADAAAYARAALGDRADSPTASYALAIALLVDGEDKAAAAAVEGMRQGDEPFVRAATAIGALAAGDRAAYSDALDAIVRDFEGRKDHLTGVPIADTALMLEALAEARGMAAHPASPLVPRLPAEA
jgi:hypothetical protein